MKHLNKSRTMLLLMVLLSSLSTYAQTMVGDGFGGRAGYDPVNLALGTSFGGELCGANKQLYLWGGPGYNLNNGSYPSSSTTPVLVSNVSNVRQFALGSAFSAYIKDDGTGHIVGSATPNNSTLISNAYYTTAVGGSSAIIAFVKTDGTVWIGGGTSINSSFSTCPFTNGNASTYCVTQILGITNAKRVAALESGNGALAILLADGTVKTVGTSSYIPASISSSTPITVSGLNNIVDIKSNSTNFYALTNSGQVYAWGMASGMGTGVLDNGAKYLPTLVTFPTGATPIKAIRGGTESGFAFALDESGNLYGWGKGNNGSFGQGASNYVSSPISVATNVRDVMGGAMNSYIVKNDNTFWGTGNSNTFCLFNLSQSTSIYDTFTQLTLPTTLCSITSYTGMPPCVAGTTAPAITPTTATNSCPTTTVNLASLAVSSTTPSGASLIWSTHKTPTSAADTLTTAQKTAVSTAGTYYAMYYDATNACYSPADSVTLTITSCVAPLTANTPTAQTATTGQAKTGNAATELAPAGGVSPYIYSNGSGDAACVAPSGATALTGLTVNANGSYSYTAPTTAGTYYYCIKVCDSATPTASCVVKTYTLTVSAPVTVTNTCPTPAVNLMTAITATNLPSGATVTWHTGTPATAANKVTDPTAISTSGMYYMAFFDGTNNCYSETSQAVTVTITACGPDTDGDGVPDTTDLDDDNDGIPDATEGTTDSDGDGIKDALDLDSDNDGINDVIEAGGTDANGDGKQDGTPNATTGQIGTGLTPPNSDNDSVPDYKDLDSDNDGVSDLQEGGSNGTDANNDGVVDGPDTDGDGIMNSVDGLTGFGDASSPALPNGDSDTLPDYRDVDSDSDGIKDIVEKAGKGTLDANNDGMVDNPTDPDGDGIANNSGLDTIPAGFGGLPTATGPALFDLMPNFTFGGTSFITGTTKTVVINVNEIKGVATSGTIEVFVPLSTGFTYSFNPTQSTAAVVTNETVNNADWDMTTTATGLKFTSKTGVIIPANGRSRIAITVKADTTGTDGSMTANITPAASETNAYNNIAVLGISIQN